MCCISGGILRAVTAGSHVDLNSRIPRAVISSTNFITEFRDSTNHNVESK